MGEEIGEGGEGSFVVDFFRHSIFSSPVCRSLTRLIRPGFRFQTSCGGVTFIFRNEFLPSFLEDPDKKWQIHFCAVEPTMTRRLARSDADRK